MNGDVINKIKSYAVTVKLDASIYLVGSGAIGKATKEIDMFIVTNKNINDSYTMQKGLSDLINDENTVVYDSHTHKHRLPEEKDKVHVLIHNPQSEFTESPIFLREFCSNCKNIYGPDNSKEMFEDINRKITTEDYIGYISSIAFGDLHSLVLSASSYDSPEKEVQERTKVVKKTVEILKRDFNMPNDLWENAEDPIEYAKSAYTFFDSLVKQLKGGKNGN